jgi:CheY-like chemotaxis protein
LAHVAGKRVLVVDDNDSTRRLLVCRLTGWGMRADAVEGAIEAMIAMRTADREGAPYDLAILDFQMPEMDGLDLAAVVRSDRQLRSMPLIMLTPYGQRGERERARPLGISAYLTKPVRQSQLEAAVAAAIAKPDRPSGAMSGPSGETAEATWAAVSLQRRVLIAEDNVVNQLVTRRQVEKLGYRTDVVANGLEAIEALSRIRYDAVLMDCQMPEMDGFQATAHIREMEARHANSAEPLHTPIIALTANALAGDRETCLSAGMDDYVSKPTDVETLRRLLDRWGARVADGRPGTK